MSEKNKQSGIDPLVRMIAMLRKLDGRPHLSINLENRKLIRADIRQMYFFGRNPDREEIARLKWR